MKIPLINSNLHAEVDEQDIHLAAFRWRLETKRNKTYASARIGGARVYLHRIIMNPTKGMVVDHHPDPNGLNCRRSNLRLCTRSQNMGNSKAHADRQGKYKGVYRHGDKFIAQICVRRRRMKIGRFDTAIDAAKAYDERARQEWGLFAKCNFNE
jgi:hypothetical protein